MKICRNASLPLGVVLALLGAGTLGCGRADPSARVEGAPALEPQAGGGACLTFQENSHCPLGAAKLAQDGESLSVNSLSEAGEDGVAIHLPEVTSFSPEGWVQSDSEGFRLIARAISEDVTTSTMTMQRIDDDIALSATFTGGGKDSTYTVNLFRDGVLLESIPHVLNGGIGTFVRPRRRCPITDLSWPYCLPPPPPFHLVQRAEKLGACRWTVHGGASNEMRAPLSSGEMVIVDRVELEEEVSGEGSYPYLTFNRIDYTANAGPMTLDHETVE